MSGVSISARCNLGNGIIAEYTAIAASGSSVHAVYWRIVPNGEEPIAFFYRRSKNSGRTWAAETQLATQRSTIVLNSIRLAVVGLKVFIVRTGTEPNGDPHIYLHISHDGGTTWPSAIRITDDNAKDPGEPCVAVAGDGRVCIAWVDGRDGPTRVYCADVLPGFGEEYEADANYCLNFAYSSQTREARRPCLAADGNRLHLVWVQKMLSGTTLVRYTYNPGDYSWKPIQELGQATNFQPPCVSAVGQNVHVVWLRRESPDGDFFNLYHCASADGGATWNAAHVLSNLKSAPDYAGPTVAVSKASVRIVWPTWSAAQSARPYAVHYLRSYDGRGSQWATPAAIATSEEKLWRPSLSCSPTFTHVLYSEGVYPDTWSPNVHCERLSEPTLDVLANGLDMVENVLTPSIPPEVPGATRWRQGQFRLKNNSASVTLESVHGQGVDPQPSQEEIRSDFLAGMDWAQIVQAHPPLSVLGWSVTFFALRRLRRPDKWLPAVVAVPARLPAGATAQGTVIVRVPAGAPPGVYEQTVVISAGAGRGRGSTEASDRFLVRVELPPPG